MTAIDVSIREQENEFGEWEHADQSFQTRAESVAFAHEWMI